MPLRSSEPAGRSEEAVLSDLDVELQLSCEQDVWDTLAAVTDPELDESVTELGFVTSVQVNGDQVSVEFHLPTFWCAANFAWMMASDMQQAVTGIPWVKSVNVKLLEHMFSDTINRGVDSGVSFQETFGDEANGELDKLREKFRRKAFQQRQELLLRHLMTKGYGTVELVELSLKTLSGLTPSTHEDQRLLRRYLEIRSQWSCPEELSDRAFITADQHALNEARFEEYLVELRGIRLNTQFNGEICRGLLRARYGDVPAVVTEVKVDFPTPRSAKTGKARTTEKTHD